MGIHLDKFGRPKAFGYGAIKRAIQSQKPDHSAKGKTSIADKPHAGTRERQRACGRKGHHWTGEPLACANCEKPYVKSKASHYP